ncbi:hypothetical protein, partial [Pleomorphomonas carboxyditropha]
MAARVGGLFLELNADASGLAAGLGAVDMKIAAYEQKMKRAATTSDVAWTASFGRIAASASMAAARIAAFGVPAVTAGLAGAAAAAQAFARSLAEVGDKAKMSGLSNRAFQELAYVAKVNRIEVDALADGMKELSLRADEWIKTGGGSAAESFQRLGFTASDLAERLKDPSALLIEITGRVQQLDKAAQIRIFDELFGGQGGERFVQLISQGADGLRRTVAEAHAVGAVLSDEVLAKADEIDRKFTAITTTIGMGMKGAIVEAVSAVDDLIESLKSVDEQGTNRLQDRLAGIGAERVDIENKILALKAEDREGIGGAWGADNSAIISTLEDQMKALAEEESRILGVLEKRRNTTSTPASAALEPILVPSTSAVAVTPPTPVPDPRKSLGYVSAYDEVMKKAREASAQLEMERQALRLTTVEADALRRAFELLNQVQSQNGEVTPQQRQAIIKLASDQAILADEIDRAKMKTDDFAKSAQEGFERVASSIGSALARTKDWQSVLSEVIMLLVDLAAKWIGPKIASALGVANQTTATTESVAATVSKTLAGSVANDNVSTAAASSVANLAAYREAIGSIESSGNYSALGQVLSSGDRAYGKYQVMGNNIGPWTQSAVGYQMTPQQFLNSPWAQDAVFNQQFGNSLARYGNANDAASVWFTGRPMATGSSAVDALGTSGSQYVTNFNSALEKTTGSLGNMNSTVSEAVGLIGKPANNATWLGGSSTASVAQSASSGPLDLGQFTGGGTSGGFLTS